MGATPSPPDGWHPGAESETRAEVVVPASRLTVEGEIEAFGDIARTATGGKGWRRAASYVVAILFLAPIGLALVIGLVSGLVSAFKLL
jgi:hypothetical protein